MLNQMKNNFTIRKISYWCLFCKSEVKPIGFDDEELCPICTGDVTVVIGDEVNPHPKQILTYDKFGHVDGGYFNPKWE